MTEMFTKQGDAIVRRDLAAKTLTLTFQPDDADYVLVSRELLVSLVEARAWRDGMSLVVES